MATISDVRAAYSLRATSQPSYPTASGTVSVGVELTQQRLANADVFWALQAVIAGGTSDLVLDTSTGSTSGSTAWTAGAAQVETATITAASGCTSNGTMALVLTSAAVTGSPLTVNVALTTAAHTTAALIAQAAVDALNAVAAVTDKFTVARSTADIVLTRKPVASYTLGTQTINLYADNDATLNLAIPAGLGVTAAASSANTTAGVATAGCQTFADGVDVDGTAIVACSGLHGLHIATDAEIGVTGDTNLADTILADHTLTKISDGTTAFAAETLTITPGAESALVAVVVAAKAS